MRTGLVEVWLHAFLISALDGRVLSASRNLRSTAWLIKNTPPPTPPLLGTEWVSRTNGLGAFRELQHMLDLKGIELPISLSRLSEINPYTDCGLPAKPFLVAICKVDTLRLNTIKMF